MGRAIFSIIFLSLILSGAEFSWAQGQINASVKPLFQSDEILEIRIETNIKTLVRKRKSSTDPYPATLSVLSNPDETHSLSVAARGKSRRTRGVCAFPPLRLRFETRPEGGIFQGQKSLKLVTHCNPNSKAQDKLILEYGAYKFYNLLTDNSHKVRLAKIDYVDADKGESLGTYLGFFIEDADDTAARQNLYEIDIPNTRHSHLDPETAARAELFYFMIGNLDFSLVKAPPGSDCCHNAKLLGADKSGSPPLYVLPYDFDNTGWVDPSYALLPANVDVRNIRERVYRGQCTRIDLVKSHRQDFQSKKPAIFAEIDALPSISDNARNKARTYLDQFFSIIEDDKKFDREIIRACL